MFLNDFVQFFDYEVKLGIFQVLISYLYFPDC